MRLYHVGVRIEGANAGDLTHVASIPGSGGSPGGGNDNLLQYACLEKPTDRGFLGASVHGVAESAMTEHTCSHSWLPKIRRPVSQPGERLKEAEVGVGSSEGGKRLDSVYVVKGEVEGPTEINVVFERKSCFCPETGKT